MTRMLRFLCLGLLALPAWAAPGTMIKDEDMKASPSATAPKVASLAKGSAVEILGREGGWTQVRASKRTGWVRILSVRGEVSSGSAADLAALTARREGQVVAVAGLRGLNEEELKSARFNAQELLLMDRYRADEAEATGFARAANLVRRQVPYLPDPKPAAGNRNSGTDIWGEGL